MTRTQLILMRIIFGLWGVLITACATQASPPTPTAGPTPATVADQLASGAPLYTQTCATAKCHGSQGEGIRSGDTFRVWPSVGPDFQARNPNAQVIFDVVRSGSEQNLRELTDQQIYDAIAYELSLNGVQPTTLLTSQNAALVLSGSAAQASSYGELYPPPGNVVLRSVPPASRASPTPVANGYLGLRVDQVAQASTIGHQSASEDGTFLILVFAFQDLTDQPINLDPKFLRLQTSTGASLEPQDIDLEYPIERFQPQTITPEHGTAAVAIFALPAGATPAQLTYDDQTGHLLSVNLAP